MEWEPNEKMTITDLRAVLMSWGIPTLSSDKKELIAEVSQHYKRIMLQWSTRLLIDRVAVLAAARSSAASSCGDDKSVGTDRPHTAVSYIGSDEAPPDDNLSHLNWIVNSDEEVVHTNKPEPVVSAACAAAPAEPAPVESAACAAAPDELTVPVVRPPSLRRAIELELAATAKVKKAAAKNKSKSKSKIYGGYLPMAGVFIDEDQKPDDPDNGEIHV